MNTSSNPKNARCQKLKTPRVHNSTDKWVRTQEAFEGVVGHDLFERAQKILEARRHKYDPERKLSRMEDLYAKFGILQPSLSRINPEMPPASAYARHFQSWDQASQQLDADQRQRTRQMVHEKICQRSVSKLT